MSVATARAITKKVLLAFAPQRIQFFGGEPLLAFGVVQEVVRFTERYCQTRGLCPPAYTITTNGTLLRPQIVKFLKRHNVGVTVSLDGPQLVNDQQRIFASGKGTHALIMEKLVMLKAAGIAPWIEAVFTQHHWQAGESIESTYDYFAKLGITKVHLAPPVGRPLGAPAQVLKGMSDGYEASTRRIMDSLLTDKPINTLHVFYILEALVFRRRVEHFCNAGYGSITVDAEGNVYPCYILIHPELWMGNIHAPNFPGENFRKVSSVLWGNTKGTFDRCRNCWAQNVCFSCCGDTFSDAHRLDAPREVLCDMIRAICRAVILKVAEFACDAAKWRAFARTIQSLASSVAKDRAIAVQVPTALPTATLGTGASDRHEPGAAHEPRASNPCVTGAPPGVVAHRI